MGINTYKLAAIKLLEVIADSSLSESEKGLWYDLGRSITDREAHPILSAVRDNPDALIFFTKNLKDKLAAVGKKDKTTWSKILDEELTYIREKE